jgi:uncharacterized protein with PIN domain
MPVKKTTPGSITKTADAQETRINNISNVSRAISRMQKDVDQKIAETKKDVYEGKEFKSIHDNMNQTLSGLNRTISALTSGVAKITADTARATAQVIRQYGQAISQDISFNKKNVVAMALAQTSPLYGYFVAKFLETDVFKRALNKMKTAIGQTLGAIIRPFKGKAPKGSEIPHMQTGGKVQATGIAKVHAGETVIPAGMTSSLEEMVRLQKEQSIYLRSVFGAVPIGKKSGIFGSLVRTLAIPFKIVKYFRKRKGNYASLLSDADMPLDNIAQNVATMMSQLLWRMDNMIEIMKANVIANRDLSTHFTKIEYGAIEGVPLYRKKKPLIRAALGFLVRRSPILAALGGLAAMAAGMPIGAAALGGGIGLGAIGGVLKGVAKRREKRGEKGGIAGFLGKERGLYANEPGFFTSLGRGIKRKYREFMPTSEQYKVYLEHGQKNLAPGVPGGAGGAGGPGGPGESDFIMRSSVQHFAEVLSDTLGGEYGYDHPIWTIKKFSREQSKDFMERKAREAKEFKLQKKATESVSELRDIQESWYSKVKKWKLWGWIAKIFTFGGGLLSSIGGFLLKPFKMLFDSLGVTKLLKTLGPLLGTLTGPVTSLAASVAPYIGGILLAAGVGVAIGTFLNRYIQPIIEDWSNKRLNRTHKAFKEVTSIREKLQEQSKKSGEEGYLGRTGLEAGRFGPHESGDLLIGEIRKGQTDYMMKNLSTYSRFPIDKLPEWRQEWQKGPGSYTRWAVQLDAYQYGYDREANFLQWLMTTKNKEMLTSQQREKAINAHTKTAIEHGAAPPTPRKNQPYANTSKNISGLSKADRVAIEEMRIKDLQAHLSTKYGLNSRDAIDAARKVMSSIPPNLMDTIMSSKENLLDYADKAYPKLKYYDLTEEDTKKMRNIGETVGKGMSKERLAKTEIDMEISKTKSLTPVIDTLIDEAEKSRKTTEKTGVAIMQNANFNTTSINNTYENTSIGNQGNSSFFSNDHWTNYNIKSPRQ